MKINNLTFTFKGKEKPFFNNLHITLSKGKITALCGQNGSGKSTLLKLLSGQLTGEQLEGNFLLNGAQYNAVHNRLPKELTKQICLVQQDVDTMLASNFTARENLQFACMSTHPTFGSLPDIKNSTITLPFDLETPVQNLSGGQRQFLAIAMALEQKPKVLLLDEPTAALDIKNAHEVMKTLAQLAHDNETYVLMVCHNPELVAEYADERIELVR